MLIIDKLPSVRAFSSNYFESALGHKDGGVLVARTYGHLRNEHSAAVAKRIVFDATEVPPEPVPNSDQAIK